MIRYRVRISMDEHVGTVEVRTADGILVSMESEDLIAIRTRWHARTRQITDAQAVRDWGQLKGRILASNYANSRNETLPVGGEIEVAGP